MDGPSVANLLAVSVSKKICRSCGPGRGNEERLVSPFKLLNVFSCSVVLLPVFLHPVEARRTEHTKHVKTCYVLWFRWGPSGHKNKISSYKTYIYILSKMGFSVCSEAVLKKERRSVVQGGAKLAPRWFPDRPKMVPNGSKMAPRWPRDGPETAQDGPKIPQDGPAMPQDGFKMAPRWPQGGPRWPHDGPRCSQDGQSCNASGVH